MSSVDTKARKKELPRGSIFCDLLSPQQLQNSEEEGRMGPTDSIPSVTTHNRFNFDRIWTLPRSKMNSHYVSVHAILIHKLYLIIIIIICVSLGWRASMKVSREGFPIRPLAHSYHMHTLFCFTANQQVSNFEKISSEWLGASN